MADRKATDDGWHRIVDQSDAIGSDIVLESPAFPMRIIARRTLLRFVDGLAGHRDRQAVKNALDAWFDEVRKATWTSAAEVKQLYATASIISAERIVFDIKGNDYRLIVAVDFQKSIVWIKWLGTHADYDRIDVSKVTYEP